MTHALIYGAFGNGFADQAYDYALANEQHFTQSVVGSQGRYDARFRQSLKLDDLGPLAPTIQDAVMARAPEFAVSVGARSFVPDELELEMVAHGDGAYFKLHIDSFTGTRRESSTERVLSAVYYFHAEPNRFSGGRLRLFPLGNREKSTKPPIDISPERDVFVVFPSWLPHEVEEVDCPSGKFADARFSINCWLRRSRQ